MEDYLQTIDEIIKREFKVDAKGGAYFLEETTLPNYPKTLVKQKGKMLIYSFDVEDSNDSVFPIFNSRVEGLTSICDYIIFYPKEKILYTFLCDLKSTATSAKKQVESGWVLAKYILNMTQKKLRFKSSEMEFRSLVFSTSNRARFNSSIKKEPYVVLEGSFLKNKLLAAGKTCYLDNLCF